MARPKRPAPPATLPTGRRQLAQALRQAADRREPLAGDTSTTAYRLVHSAADGLPGVTVDRYDEYLVVSLVEPALQAREEILDAVGELGGRGVYLKLPPKQASRVVDPRRDDLAPAHAVRGDDAPDPLVVLEQGLGFEVRLGHGLATGIFLDQRHNRQRVRQLASGAQVLNLFGYTGGFTVAAIAGGARQTVTVDISRPALDWAARNLERLGPAAGEHRLLREDAQRWLARAARRNERFDLVILDPPSFATTKRSRFSALKDYRALAAAALGATAVSGRLLACTNHRGISAAKLRRDVEQAAEDAGRRLGRVRRLELGIDYPAERGAAPHPKSLLAELDDGPHRSPKPQRPTEERP